MKTAAPRIGERIAEARAAAGMTQAALAVALGLDRTAVSKMETGARDVTSMELRDLADVLGRSIEWFVAPRARPLTLADLRRRRSAILRIARRHGARSVRVFGSVARGEADAASDVDLLVDLRPTASLMDQAAILVELRELLGRSVDVVTKEGLREHIRERVLSEAVAL